ncbi:MAG TPA: hypothetical protein VKA74_12525 [Myxococcota bacterium]|nr:hypothetical protein [Myxococcota bacterium]
MERTKRGPRRVSRTVERRLAAIEGCERRGESLKAYADRTGQSVWALYEAKRRARQAGVLPPHRGSSKTTKGEAGRRKASPRRFVEAVATTQAASRPTRPEVGPSWRLRLPGGAVLESATPLDAASLERLVAGLGRPS